jgi:hypothetical protein
MVLAAEAAEVANAEVIGQDEHDVGPFGGQRRDGRDEEQGQCVTESDHGPKGDHVEASWGKIGDDERVPG